MNIGPAPLIVPGALAPSMASWHVDAAASLTPQATRRRGGRKGALEFLSMRLAIGSRGRQEEIGVARGPARPLLKANDTPGMETGLGIRGKYISSPPKYSLYIYALRDLAVVKCNL